MITHQQNNKYLRSFGEPVAVVCIAVYVFSMLLWPFVSGCLGWDYTENIWNNVKSIWSYVQIVWDRWQGLNVGMLALSSSIFAIKSVKYRAEKQRQRDFSAAKAFLPAILSELTLYLESSAKVFLSKLEVDSNRNVNYTPELSKEYKEIFRDCIRYAEPDVGNYLSKILMRLQIHDSRMRRCAKSFKDDRCVYLERNLINDLYQLGELQVLIRKLFGFARNIEKLDLSLPNWSDFRDAYTSLGILCPETIIDRESKSGKNLEDFTRKKIIESFATG